MATVSSSLGFILVDPVRDDPDGLASVASSETTVLLGAFLLLIDAIAVVAIPVLLYPTFEKHNGHLARLRPGSRIVESVVLVIGGLLAAVTSIRHAVAGAAVSNRISGDALVAGYDWGVLLGIMLFFALAALLVDSLLYDARLVPRWLAVWGLIGIGLLLIEGAPEAFDVP